MKNLPVLRISLTFLNLLFHEKCIKKGNNFYCENIEIQSITELLSRSFNIKLILREAIINPVHKINNSEIIISSNIFFFYKAFNEFNLSK